MKTIILCGGKGSRLGPAGEQLPKALVPLNGKPCLQYIVESYVAKGYREFVLCVGHLGDRIVEFCRSHLTNAHFESSDAGPAAGMLERLHRVRDQIGDRAWVAYGDTLIDVDLDDMLAEHLRSGAALSLTTASVRSPFGLVDSRDGWLTSFREKPVQTYFVGHMLIDRSVLDDAGPELIRKPDGDGLVALIQQLTDAGRVRVHPYSGPQITFNTQAEVDRAQRDVIEFFTQAEAAASEGAPTP